MQNAQSNGHPRERYSCVCDATLRAMGWYRARKLQSVTGRSSSLLTGVLSSTVPRNGAPPDTDAMTVTMLCSASPTMHTS